MADAARPGGLARKTLLLTDIEGSTRLWERDPDRMGMAIARHDEIVRAATEGAGGELVKHRGEGDSTFSAFDGTRAALDAAVEIQRAMAAEAWPTSEPLRVRVGIHAGEVEIRDGDLYGRAVNRAARIRALGAGDSILLSSAAVVELRDRLPTAADLVDLGEHPLRGLAGTEHLFALAHPDLPDPDVVLAYLRQRAAPPVPAALRIHDDAEIVGREPELAALRDAWTAAVERRASLALLAGEPGVGKTRLASALAEHAAAHGALVLYGRCDEEPLRPYQPFAEALGNALDRLSHGDVVHAAGDFAADLALVRPELRARIAVRGEASGERFVLFDAIAVFLARISTTQPVLVVLDDLHWADEPTLALLQHVLRANGATATMVVGTYRETDVSADSPLVRALVTLRRGVPTLEVALQGLDRDGVATLLGADHRDVVDDVWAASDGNPFFVVELRRELGRSGKGAVPRPVRESVVDRVARLAAPTQDFVHAAAIAGVDVDVAVAATAAAVDAAAARPAVQRGLLDELAEGAHRVRFAHALVRAAVLDAMTATQRAALHRRVAVAIETVHAHRLDQHAARLAHHYVEAGALDARGPAFTWSMRAGRHAGALLAYEEAEEHFRTAARIAGEDDDAGGRITAELELAEVMRRSGRPATGQALATSAQVAASDIGATELAGWAVFTTRFGQALGTPGNLELIRRTRWALEANSPWKGPLDIAFAGELVQAGEVDSGAELLYAARDRANAAGDGILLALALTGIHMFLDRLAVGPDEILAALATADEAAAPSVRLSPRVLRVQTESLRIGERVAAGDVTGARDAAAAFTARYGEETGTVEANIPLFRIADALLSGDREQWRQRVASFRADAELSAACAPQLMALDMSAAWLEGRFGELAPFVEELPPSLMFVRPGLAVALAEAGRVDDARRVVAECGADDGFGRRARSVSGRVELALLGNAAAAADDADAADALYAVLADRSGQVAAWAGWFFWGAFDAVLGRLARTCGRLDDAVAHFTAARDLHDRGGWWPLAARSAADLAETLRARGYPGDVDEADRLAAGAGQRRPKSR